MYIIKYGRKYTGIGLLVLGLYTGAGAEVPAESMRTITGAPFTVGERLVFSVDYGFINAGTATMSIVDTVTFKGRPCYRIETTAKSNKFFDTFYKVRDRVESIVDREGLFSWKFVKHLEEGKWWCDQQIHYDQVGHKAYYHETRKKKKPKSDTLAIPPYVQDILSAFYYVRTQDLKVGKPIYIDTQADNKVYPLEVKVHKREKVKVPAGKFKCVKVEPVMRTAGIFNQKGRLWIWLTDDERRLPVLMKSKILVGSISTRLQKFKTPRITTENTEPTNPTTETKTDLKNE